jgi:hypothetical protein
LLDKYHDAAFAFVVVTFADPATRANDISMWRGSVHGVWTTGSSAARARQRDGLSPSMGPICRDRPLSRFASGRRLTAQMAMKLQPEKARLPVFVVDSIERPSEN